MPKIDGAWYCDVCGEFAEYHRCEEQGHEYYCRNHWAQGDLTLKQLKRGYKKWVKSQDQKVG